MKQRVSAASLEEGATGLSLPSAPASTSLLGLPNKAPPQIRWLKQQRFVLSLIHMLKL